MKQSPRNSIWCQGGFACAGCRSHIAAQHMWDALSPPGTASEEPGWADGADGTQQLLPPRRAGAQEHPQPDTTARLQKQATHRDTHTHMKFPASRERGKQCFHHRLQVHKYVKPKAAAAAGDGPKRLWEDTRSPLTAVQPPGPPSLQGRWQRRGKPSQAQMRSCCACSPLLGCRRGAAPPTPKPSPITEEAKPTATPAEPFLSLMLSA